MGINGLLPVLKPICDRKSLSSFAGLRVGIDASSWLHKGAFSCALELATGAPTTRYVDYCMFRVRMLLHFGAIPVLVFDGAPLPMKAATNAKRRESRTKAREAGMAALARNDPAAAQEQFQRGCEVTHEMARAVVKEVRKLNVEYVVAPYEADAQLAWLSASDDVDVVVTEDSDLVVYGAKKIFYKMNKDGEGDLYQTKNLMALDDPNMRNFTPQMFTWVCVFSGCDFFEGVGGLGIRKAHALVKRYKCIQRTLKVIRFDTKYKVDARFADRFHRACLVFRHQTVFDRISKNTKHLNAFDDEARLGVPEHIFKPSPDLEEDLNFIGRLHSEEVAVGVADATRHPVTLVEYQDPLDVVERPVPASRTQSFFQSAASRNPGVTASVGGFQVNRARRSATQVPLFRSTAGEVRRTSPFFSVKGTQPPAHIGHSAAVSRGFKAPVRSTSDVVERGNTSTPPAASQTTRPRIDWTKRSLSRLNPGNIARPSLAKRPASARTSGSLAGGKRQRTMKEMSQSAAVSKAASRFADLSKKTGSIGPYMQANSANARAPEWSKNKSRVVESSDDLTDKFEVSDGDGKEEPFVECPSSPDSQTYQLFEAVEQAAVDVPSASPITPLPVAVEGPAVGGNVDEPFDAHISSEGRPSDAAESKEKVPESPRPGVGSPPTLRRQRGSASTPTLAMMEQVRTQPRQSPRRKMSKSAMSASDLTRYSGSGAKGRVISRPSL